MLALQRVAPPYASHFICYPPGSLMAYARTPSCFINRRISTPPCSRRRKTLYAWLAMSVTYGIQRRARDRRHIPAFVLVHAPRPLFSSHRIASYRLRPVVWSAMTSPISSLISARQIRACTTTHPPQPLPHQPISPSRRVASRVVSFFYYATD